MKHFLAHPARCSENTWSNLIFSEVIGGTLFEAVRLVNEERDLTSPSQRFGLMFDAPWMPGHFNNQRKSKCSKQDLDGVPGAKIIDAETNETIMLKHDMSLNRKMMKINFACMLAHLNRVNDDWRDGKRKSRNTLHIS